MAKQPYMNGAAVAGHGSKLALVGFCLEQQMNFDLQRRAPQRLDGGVTLAEFHPADIGNRLSTQYLSWLKSSALVEA